MWNQQKREVGSACFNFPIMSHMSLDIKDGFHNPISTSLVPLRLVAPFVLLFGCDANQTDDFVHKKILAKFGYK
jgi:hypothetical protein